MDRLKQKSLAQSQKKHELLKGFRNKNWLLRVFCFLLIPFLAGCNKRATHQFPSPPIEVMKVQEADVPIAFDYAARVAPFRETQVRARVGGILLKRYFQEGSYVERGEVLFDIDPKAYELAVIRAQAQVAQARVAYNKAERDAQRAGQLVKQNVQTPAFKEQALAEQMVKEALLRQAEAELSTAELNLTYTKVQAPISGITSREAVPEGSLIGANAGSSLLTTITQIDPIYVNFSYSDYDAKQIKNYLKQMSPKIHEDDLRVAIFLGDDKLYPYQGKIDFTAPTLDSSTGTISVRAVAPNKEHSLTPGQFVRVRLLGLKRPHSIAIPEEALMQDSLGAYVFVVKQLPNPAAKNNQKLPAMIDVAFRRDVKVARQLANRDWLLEDVVKTPIKSPADKSKSQRPQFKIVGLENGERILTKGHLMVQSGLTAMGAAAVRGMPVTVAGEYKPRPDDAALLQAPVQKTISKEGLTQTKPAKIPSEASDKEKAQEKTLQEKAPKQKERLNFAPKDKIEQCVPSDVPTSKQK